MHGHELVDFVPIINLCILVAAIVVFFRAHLVATRLMQDNYYAMQKRLDRLERAARDRLGLQVPDSTPGGS